MLMVCQTYTMSMLKNPSYSSSSACGVSQWNKVIQGCIPAHYSELGRERTKKKGWDEWQMKFYLYIGAH